MDTTGTLVSRSLRWYEVWKEVLLHPSKKTFIRILSDPAVTSKQAYLWMAVTGALMGVYVSTRPVAFNFGRLVMFLIAGSIFTVLILAVEALILHWSANLFGGQGHYDHMVYAFGAINAPAYLIGLILMLVLSSQETLRSLIQLAVGLYFLFLVIQAIKAVAGLNSRMAFLALTFPLLLFGGLAFCGIAYSQSFRLP